MALHAHHFLVDVDAILSYTNASRFQRHANNTSIVPKHNTLLTFAVCSFMSSCISRRKLTNKVQRITAIFLILVICNTHHKHTVVYYHHILSQYVYLRVNLRWKVIQYFISSNIVSTRFIQTLLAIVLCTSPSIACIHQEWQWLPHIVKICLHVLLRCLSQQILSNGCNETSSSVDSVSCHATADLLRSVFLLILQPPPPLSLSGRERSR